MAKTRTKSDLLIKVSTTSMKILDMSQDGVKAEQTNKGTITGMYSGKHWDTVEWQMNRDGTSKFSVKFIQMTSKGTLFGVGQGTGEQPNAKGITKEKGEGTVWTDSPKLSEYNGAKWTCDVETNLMTEKATIAVNFQK